MAWTAARQGPEPREAPSSMTDLTARRPGGHQTCHHSTFSMTCEEFELLLKRCSNQCEVCRTPAEQTARGVLCIDHDHRYGMQAVRGMVCDRCNWDLHKVDTGLTELTPAIRSYLLGAWFIELNDIRRRRNPLVSAHPHWHRWQEFRRATNGKAAAVIVAFVDWYLRRPRSVRPVQMPKNSKG